MKILEDFLGDKPVRFRQQLVGFAWVPLFILQFINLISWIAAKPVAVFEFEGLEHAGPPVAARTYYMNHGSPVFSDHGTIADEPLVFLLWVALFLLTFAGFVVSQKYVVSVKA